MWGPAVVSWHICRNTHEPKRKLPLWEGNAVLCRWGISESLTPTLLSSSPLTLPPRRRKGEEGIPRRLRNRVSIGRREQA
ncbi:unnamed protein product [Urochloa humidicola]